MVKMTNEMWKILTKQFGENNYQLKCEVLTVEQKPQPAKRNRLTET